MQSTGNIIHWLSERIARAAGLDPAEVAGDTPFEAFGITSTEAVGISGELEELLRLTLPDSLLYEHPTIDTLATALSARLDGLKDAAAGPAAAPRGGAGASLPVGDSRAGDSPAEDPVCVVGMACRFPEAESVQEFWQNLVEQVDSSTDVPADRWDAHARYSPGTGAPGTAYTTKGAFLRDLAGFDPGFFGIAPREAARMDPQQRLLLEVSWQALENASLPPDRLRGSRTGVFVGMLADGQYATLQRETNEHAVDDPHFGIGTASSVAAGRIAYLLDLHGPALTVDTACSSSLVALHLAAKSIGRGECDQALVGGVSATIHPDVVQSACRSHMLSPDGRCKTFDASADGFLMGEGVGVVVLERLSRAVARGHQVLAVLRGSATNQDGATNGLTAPNPQAQVAVVREALADAAADPSDIGFIEAHGTGTALGDAMEMSALQEVFADGRTAGRPLVIGSLKTNVGHLLGAAGIAGVIKTVLVLRHGRIPANLHLERRNPAVDWDVLPTLLPDRTLPWPDDDRPRLAGVSSFGWSGSNAHAVLAQPPLLPSRAPGDGRGPGDDWQAILLSAHTRTGLTAVADQVRGAVPDDSEGLADLAYTTQAGRSALGHRTAVVVRGSEEARTELLALAAGPRSHRAPRSGPAPVTFLLPGTGDLYPGMAQRLYDTEPAFRDALGLCAAEAAGLGVDLIGALFPPDAGQAPTGGGLAAMLGRADASPASETPLTARTDVAHAAVFAVGYACAALWTSLGVRPSALIGYSLGEYTAACLAGVMEPRDAVRLVIGRARLLDEAAEGVMLTVALPAGRTAELLGSGLYLAADNGHLTSVVSGPERVVGALERRLDRQGVAHRRLPAAQPMHSPLLEPLRDGLTALLSAVRLSAPRLPLVSNVTGTWLTDEQAVDPGYWGDHMCRTVRFGPGVEHLIDQSGGVLLEMGAGQLGSLAAQVAIGRGSDAPAPVPTLPSVHRRGTEREFLVRAAARLWELGAGPDWAALHARRTVRTAELPGYPFEHQRFWPVSRPEATPVPVPETAPASVPVADTAPVPVAAALYTPVWQPGEEQGTAPVGPFLVFADTLGLGESLGARLGSDAVCATVLPGTAYEDAVPGGAFRVRPGEPEDYRRLLERLTVLGKLPRTVVHLWSVTGPRPVGEDPAVAAREQQLGGFQSVVNLGRALAETVFDGVRVLVVTDLAQAVDDQEPVQAGKATLAGARLAIPQEHRGIACRTLDLRPADGDAAVAQVIAELGWPGTGTVIAYRDGKRLVERFEPTAARSPREPVDLREEGVYLITGGLGGIGLLLAGHLARRARARLVLMGRGGLPPRERWTSVLGTTAPGDPVAGRIRAVLALEELGAEVMVAAADVADPAAVRAVVTAAKERFGALHGVVHGAGTTSRDAFATVSQLTPETVDAHFGPKVYGTLALDAALRGEQLDFRVALSSMSAVLGGLGFAAYAAANAYLDGYARVSGWQSVNWDTWRSTVDPELGASLAEFSIAPDEALGWFDRALRDGRPRLVVAVGDLGARLRQWVPGGDPVTAAPAAPAGAVPELYARPDLEVAFVAASSDYESRLAALWRDALGLSEVGVRDNFFDLGGDSVIGLNLVEKIRKEFRRALPAVALFEAPTIADMARYLSEHAPKNPSAAGPRYAPAVSHAAGHPVGTSDASGTTPATGDLTGTTPAEPPVAAAAGAAAQPATYVPGTPVGSGVARSVARSAAATAGSAGPGRDDVAIIGMAGRFPGAADVDAFWDVLSSGTETIRFFTEDELIEAGVAPETVRRPDYVKARPVLDGIDLFDAEFFGFNAREAALADPQQRLFLECVWESLENAGYAPRSAGVPVGVFGGTNISTYLHRLINSPELLDGANEYQLVVSNDKDSLTLNASYRLNLTGPSVTVQTFCSTSLVALHLARRSLLAGDCDMAVAGGVSVRVPDRVGHLYEEGGMETPDGHVRTFDAEARGAVFGDGCAVVVLKRLSDALADGDTISAVIKASALNNDGNLKVGFTAPSVRGQAAVIEKAHAEGGIDPRTLGYVEAHGTATELGDPIELAALTRAFGDTGAKQYCAIGSVKTNVGHLDRAAGGAGLIKTVLSLQHRQIPPSLHYRSPNPEIDFADSPFYVNTRLAPWHVPQGQARRAGVNSLGMGGTNAHVVLEEAPERPARQAGPPRPEILVLSARTEAALEDAAANLARHLRHHPGVDLGDVAFTLQAGRERFAHRMALTCQDTADAVRLLEDREGRGSGRVRAAHSRTDGSPCVLVLTDMPEHPAGEAADLYHGEPEFRRIVDECTVSRPALRAAFNDPSAAAAGPSAAFLTGYALARSLLGWGVRPQALIGRGTGEYAAAVLAGVLTVDDAFALLDDPRAAEHLELRPPRLPYYAADADGTLRAAAPYAPEYWTPGARTAAETVEFPASADRLLIEIGTERLFSATEGVPLGHAVRVLPPHGAPDEVTGDQALRDCLAGLWLGGGELDWRAYHGERRPYRIPLPTYPFQRRSFWIDPAPAAAPGRTEQPALSADPRQALGALSRRLPEEWLYVPGWRQAPALPAAAGLGGTWLLFADDIGVAKRLAAQVRTDGGTAVMVRPGTGFEKSGPQSYTIVPGQSADYVTLLDDLAQEGLAPGRMVHLWALGQLPEGQQGHELAMYSLMYLARATAETGLEDCVLRVVTAGAFQVTGDDLVSPAKALVTGPVKMIPLEYSGIGVRHVDLGTVPARASAARAAEAVAREFNGPGGPLTVALRGRRRWIPSYERVGGRGETDPGTVLRDEGVYLITGGLGGIGTAMAERLASTVSARLVLVGRTGLPGRDDWDALLADPATAPDLVRRIGEVRRLEAAGAEVLVIGADVSQKDEMDKAVNRALGRFGRIDGVIHAAGLPGEGLMALKTPESVARVLTPKVAGTDVLLAALEGIPVDFVVLFSSITSITGGGPGQADYCAANAYLDATAQAATPGGPRVLSVNWGEWLWNGWDSGLSGFDETVTEFLRANRERIGLSYDDGWRALLRAMALPEAQVVVSTQDLPQLVDISSRLTIEDINGQGPGAPAPGQRHPRPPLGNAFVAPEGERAERIAAIWAEILGLAEVGVQDSFFDLGGNSLLGLQLVTKVRTAVGGSLPPHVLYEAQTIEKLLAYLDSGGRTAGEQDEGRLAGRRSRGAWRREGLAARERGTAR